MSILNCLPTPTMATVHAFLQANGVIPFCSALTNDLLNGTTAAMGVEIIKQAVRDARVGKPKHPLLRMLDEDIQGLRGTQEEWQRIHDILVQYSNEADSAVKRFSPEAFLSQVRIQSSDGESGRGFIEEDSFGFVLYMTGSEAVGDLATIFEAGMISETGAMLTFGFIKKVFERYGSEITYDPQFVSSLLSDTIPDENMRMVATNIPDFLRATKEYVVRIAEEYVDEECPDIARFAQRQAEMEPSPDEISANAAILRRVVPPDGLARAKAVYEANPAEFRVNAHIGFGTYVRNTLRTNGTRIFDLDAYWFDIFLEAIKDT